LRIGEEEKGKGRRKKSMRRVRAIVVQGTVEIRKRGGRRG